jgi:23S rRNA (adenine2503-C2)-methyltransferase
VEKMINLLDLSMDDLKQWMKTEKESEFRAKQVFDWIYKEVWNFHEMKNIPGNLREKLKQSFYIDIPEIVHISESEMDGTKKILFAFKDGNLIESVVMTYKHGNTICVSTQVGCRMGCKFCASTIGGMVRNLSSGEILAQVMAAQFNIKERISNIVLMGSGEPLDNYDNVLKFIKLVNAAYGLNIGQRHITLSTCGIVPKIRDLADRNLQITLAISLHAAEDESRKKIMPVAYKYSMDEIIEACRYYINKTGRRITFEYALVKGINNHDEEAFKLGQLLKGMLCHVNLIPVNTIKEKTYEKPSLESIMEFQKILNNAGIETTIRREMGADINAACGQLRRSYINDTTSKEGK